LRRQRRLGTGRIGVPTLLIWGEADAALGRELVPGTGQYVDDLTVALLPGVSHWVQQEAPAQVNEILVGWLRGTGHPA
jgi:pimeloyl-ACP methyl ester carboxylesterase